MSLDPEVETPVRVYVGATEEQLIPCKVLEYSIRKATRAEVRVRPLFQGPIDIPSPTKVRTYTTFSFQRFIIPELQAYSGRAIYLDSDMIVYRDIQHLWTMPFAGAQVLVVPRPEEGSLSSQFSVLVLDCAALSWNVREIVAGLDRGEFTYRRLMDECCVAERVSTAIPRSWNSLEQYRPGETALLHFTHVPTQPWLSTGNPLGSLWCQLLLEALDEGALTAALVREHIAKGHLRPSLSWQIDRRVTDPREIPRRIRSTLDGAFTIPYLKPPSLLRRAGWFIGQGWQRIGDRS